MGELQCENIIRAIRYKSGIHYPSFISVSYLLIINHGWVGYKLTQKLKPWGADEIDNIWLC